MKELEKEFIAGPEVKGFLFKQIRASSHAYIYRSTDNNGKLHYETFERKESKNRDYVIAGKAIHSEAHIRYPRNNDFGVWAWCIRDLDKAIQKFDELNKKNNE